MRIPLAVLAAVPVAFLPGPALAASPCGPTSGAAPPGAGDEGKPAPLFEGLGNLDFPITTDSFDAQRYFEQGLLLAYGFNHAEAARSFREVVKRDPDGCMGWWGVALVLGPNINAPMMEESVEEAWRSLNKAHEFSHLASPKEKALVDALMKRYLAEAPEDRAALDLAYAAAMRDVAKAHPGDVDVLALAAEALMDCHPWDFFDRKTFEAREWTPEILDLLDRALALDASHPGANHLYIHATEASPNPERALPCAERLGAISPAQGHLVHMPSHVYIRTGQYHEGSLANERAIRADDAYVTSCHAQGVYPVIYRTHNHHFLWATATFEGASRKALAAAASTAEHVTEEMIRDPFLGGVLQHWSLIPLYASVRFARWEEILAWPAAEDDLVYMRAIRHWARGLALERTGDRAAADAELAALRAMAEDPGLEELKILDLNSTAKLVAIGERVLTGEIATSRGDHEAAVASLREAVALEDGLTYDEPPDWFFPARQNLGAALLAAGKPAEAEAVYREDLFLYPENGWSLFGLRQSLAAQGKTAEAEDVAARFAKAWANADIELQASRM
jgi:tetratricopeptide (TPR) repeat protein